MNAASSPWTSLPRYCFRVQLGRNRGDAESWRAISAFAVVARFACGRQLPLALSQRVSCLRSALRTPDPLAGRA